MSDHDDEFVEFVRDASPRLLKAAWFICGDTQVSQDLVQSAFEKVFLRWGRLRDAQPYAYARRCMLNSHIDTTRRRRRDHPTAVVPDRAQEDVWPEDTAFLAAALKQLSFRERQIVVMRHYADMSEADVADALGLSVGTVKSTASRSLAKLRATLAPLGDNHVR